MDKKKGPPLARAGVGGNVHKITSRGRAVMFFCISLIRLPVFRQMANGLYTHVVDASLDSPEWGAYSAGLPNEAIFPNARLPANSTGRCQVGTYRLSDP